HCFRIEMAMAQTSYPDMNTDLNKNNASSQTTDSYQLPVIISPDNFLEACQSIIDQIQFDDPTYCVGGRMPVVGEQNITLNNVGDISLPLTDEDAQSIIKQSKPLKIIENPLYSELRTLIIKREFDFLQDKLFFNLR
ncbi:unnamed protein product, partial [Didymodactylos carnosus]